MTDLTFHAHRHSDGQWHGIAVEGLGRPLWATAVGYENKADAEEAIDSLLQAVEAGNYEFVRGGQTEFCPRCRRDVHERLDGSICSECRAQLEQDEPPDEDPDEGGAL